VKVEAANLRRRDVDVVGAREVARVRGPQEAEAVREHLEHAFAEDADAFLGLILKERKDDFLLAHAVGAVDFLGVRHVDQLGDMQVFEFG
jgi:hypothetical protein